jgi:PPOX class probable F420-dependent enzyme
MERMTEAEWRRFIDEHTSPAIATVVRTDGRPHASPIWIYPTEDEIVMTMFHESVKVKALARDRRMTLVVQDDRPPYRFAMIEGRVVLTDDRDAVREWAGRLGGRYMGADRAEEFAERNGVPGELLGRMSIERVHAFKNVTD